MPDKLNLVGQTFWNITVINKSESIKNHSAFLCRCICGKEIILIGCELKRGNHKSCGCRRGRKKPYDRNHPLYDVWKGMKARCRDINHISYKNYGGRGIMVCDEWKNDYLSFYNWAIISGWKEKLQIDRINNNGNYCPENCQVVTAKENARNTRHCKMTIEKVVEIRKSNEKSSVLSEKYGIHISQVQRIRSNRAWIL